MKALALIQQVKEVLDSSETLTLKYDGTTKKGLTLMEVELATETETLLCGARQQVGGTAEETVDTIKEVIEDIESISIPTTSSNGHIQTKIKNTMSDRCKTNACIEKKLDEQMDHDIYHWKCSVHPLDTIAKDSNKTIKNSYEKDILRPVDLFVPQYESITLGIIKGVSKIWSFAKVGLQQEVNAHFLDVASEVERSSFYERFVGNPFHIYFHDAGLTYAYRDQYLDYIQNVHGGKDGLIWALGRALSNGHYNSSLRALGIMGKRCTGPWMKYSEDPTLHILDMNKMYNDAVISLTSWSTDASSLISGSSTATVFPAMQVESRGDEEDKKTIAILQELSVTILDVIKRQCADQLPGGKFSDPPQEVIDAAKYVGTNNMSGERRFATIDADSRNTPNAAVGSMETKCMTKSNKTFEWLSKKSNEEKMARLSLAKKDGRKLVMKDKERKKAIAVKVLEKIRAKRKALKETEETSREKIEFLIQEILDSGGGFRCQDNI